MTENINIGGRVHSTATGNVVTGANEIFDDDKNKKQSVINAETDAALENRYTKAETYNKTELDNMITTPDIDYKNYDTYAAMLAETNHPAGAIYRVANYDGTQVVTNKYSEYSWDGTQYKLMAVRDHGIDNEPTAGSNNFVKSGGVKSYVDNHVSVAKNTSTGHTDISVGGVTIPVASVEDVSRLQTKVSEFSQDVIINKKSDATLHSNKYIKNNGTEGTLNGWSYYSISVEEGQRWHLESRCGGDIYLWFIKDSSDNVLSHAIVSSSIQLNSDDLTIPSGGATLYINACTDTSSDRNAIVIKQKVSFVDISSVISGDSTLDEIIGNLSELETKQKESLVIAINELEKKTEFTTQIAIIKKNEATRKSGYYISANGTEGSLASYSHYDLAVTPGQKFTLTAFAGGMVPLVVVKDSEDNVVYTYNGSDSVVLQSHTFFVPTNGAIMFLNARTDSSADRNAIVINLYKDVVDGDYVFVDGMPIREYIDSSIAIGQNLFHCDLTSGNESYIVSPFNSTYNIKTYFIISSNSTLSNNPCFKYVRVCLVNKVTGTETLVHDCSDDITPANFNSVYIGANHADSDLRKITVTNHGKTFADIGSQWSNSGDNKTYTLVGIVDDSHLLMMGNNWKTYPLFEFYRGLLDNCVLTHISGATHTDSITIESGVNNQWYSSLIVKNLAILLDGKEISESGVYYFNHLDICEIYDVFNPASVLDKIKAGVGTFTENPNPNSFPTADKVTQHSIIYGFDSAAYWTITTNWLAYQNLNIGYFGFTQQGQIVGTNRKMYIPKTLPIGGSDYRTIVAYTSLASSVNFTSDYWENPLLPPDRWLQYSSLIGLHSGYMFDYGVGGTNRKDCVSTAINLATTLKCYPHGIDKKITVQAGDNFSAVVWRSYLDVADINANGLISQNAFSYNGHAYIYGDFNQQGIYELSVPNGYVGKIVTVLEKSDNVELLSQLSNNKIMVKVTSSSPMYGYIVLKI